MRKFLVAMALAVPLGLSGLAIAPAAAKVTVDFTIGINLSGGKRISCSEGRRSLERRGFQMVRTIDCRGMFYVYRAWRYGGYFEIALRASNGRVADYRRLR